MLGEFGSFIVWSYALSFGAIGGLCLWLIIQNRRANKRLELLQQRDGLNKS